MPTVRIPTPLRQLTGGEPEVEVVGSDLREVIANLDAAHPGFGERLLADDGGLRRFVNVFVRDEDVRFQDGLDTKVQASDTVSIVPAVAGGSWPGVRRSRVRGRGHRGSGRSARGRAGR